MTAIEGGSLEANDVLKWLAAWDGAMLPDRPEPLIFQAWWREFARSLYADELGGAFRGQWRSRAVFVDDVLADRNGAARWCDDVRTPRTESCAELLAASLDKALASLRQRYGDDPNRWRWGDAHEARLRHRPLSRSTWLRPYFDVAVPSGGDDDTINRGQMDWSDETAPFENRHASSLRAIYDLAAISMTPGGGSDEVFDSAEKLLGRNGIAEVIGVIRLAVSGQRDQRRVVPVVVPKRVKIVAAFAARFD